VAARLLPCPLLAGSSRSPCTTTPSISRQNVRNSTPRPTKNRDSYVIPVEGRVRELRDNDAVQVGLLQAFLLRGDDAPDIHEACDAISLSLAEVADILFDEEGMMRDEVVGAFPGAISQRVLYLESLTLEERCRGRNLGLLVAARAIHVFGGGCSLVVVKPFPVQYSNNVSDGNRPAFEASRRKLQRYWSKLGLEPIEGTEHYAMNLGCKDCPPPLARLAK
jgi:hypothetical protein